MLVGSFGGVGIISGTALVASAPAAYAACSVAWIGAGTQYCGTGNWGDDANFQFSGGFVHGLIASGDGIITYAFGGDATVDVDNGFVTVGGTGIFAGAFFGDVEIDAGPVTAGDSGIIGVAFGSGWWGGDVDIDIDGTVTAAGFAGIGAFAIGGDADINFEDETVINFGRYGVFAFATDDVDIEGDDGNVWTTGTGIVGISLDGDVFIDYGDVEAGRSGVLAWAYDGDIDIDAHGDIEADGWAGIGAFAWDGDVDIDIENRDIRNTDGAGIIAYANGGDVDIEARRSFIFADGRGIDATAVDGDVTIDAGRVVAFGSGVLGTAYGGDVDIDAHGDITAAGYAGIGAFAYGYRADANIDFENRTVTNYFGDGVVAYATDDVDIEGRRSEVYAFGDGITGEARYGDVAIDAGRVRAGGNGVVGTAWNGNVDIDAHGNITADGYVGIGAFAFDGDADLDFEGRTVTNWDGAGVVAVAVDGDVDIEGRWSRIYSAGTGINATAYDGNVWIDTGRITSFNGSGVVGTAYDGNVNIDVNGRIEADNGLYGAAATAYGGNATVTVNADIDPPWIGAMATTYGWGNATVYNNADIEAEAIGIFAASYGFGNVLVDTDDDIAAGFRGIQTVNVGPGRTDIDVNGDIGGLYAPFVFGDGVNAYGFGTGEMDIELYRNHSIFALDDGIDVTNEFGYGNVFVDLHRGSFIFAGDNGIQIDYTGRRNVDIDIGYDAGIIAFGRAISIDATGLGFNDDANVDINNNGFLIGRGTFNDPTIFVRTDGTATIENRENGFIAGGLALAPSALVIDVDGVGDDARAVIENDGTIVGRVALTDNGDTFNNRSTNSWYTEGNNYFGSGWDDLNNTGYVYAFGTTNWYGLDIANNYEDAAIVLWDGDTDERLYTSGDYYGDYGFLALDANLIGDALSNSDRFRIGGQASGFTWIDVNNLYSGPTTYDPTGTLVVDADSSLDGTGAEFGLFNGPIVSGLFTWDLEFDADGQDWYLRNSPNELTAELASVTTLAQFINGGFTGTWHERTADLRDNAQPGTANTTPPSDEVNDHNGGVWFRAFGDQMNRSFTGVVDGPNNVVVANSSQQTTGGFVGGIDRVIGLDNGGLIVGVLGSYQASRTSYQPTGTMNNTAGTGVGAYVTLLSGGLFLDVLAQAQFFTIEHAAAGQFAETANTNGRTYGVTIDGGYRFGDGNVHVEPLATFAYSSTTVDGFTMMENDVTFGTGASALGRLGLRFSASIDAANATIEPFIEASAWHQFLGANTVTLSGGGESVTMTDSTGGTTYRAGGGIEVRGAGSLSGFITGEYTFGNGVTGYGGQAGLRFGF